MPGTSVNECGLDGEGKGPTRARPSRRLSAKDADSLLRTRGFFFGRIKRVLILRCEPERREGERLEGCPSRRFAPHPSRRSSERPPQDEVTFFRRRLSARNADSLLRGNYVKFLRHCADTR